MGILGAVVVACILALFLRHFKSDIKTDFDPERHFGNGLEKIQFSFTNQTDRFWESLRSRGLAHLRNKDPPQPLVFLLATPPAAHEWVDCLAIKLAGLLDPRHKKNLARMYGEKEKASPSGETKITMDNLLKREIEALHEVILIHNLEPPSSATLTTSVSLLLRRSKCTT